MKPSAALDNALREPYMGKNHQGVEGSTAVRTRIPLAPATRAFAFGPEREHRRRRWLISFAEQFDEKQIRTYPVTLTWLAA